MISDILKNLYDFALSIPTNLVIIAIICIFMVVVLKKGVKDCIRLIVAYLLIGLLLGIFGITMPSFVEVGRWVKDHVSTLISDIW